MVAWTYMVHILNNRQLQVPYFWRQLSDTESGEGNDMKERHAIIRKNRNIAHGPRVNQGRKRLTEFLGKTIEVFDDWMNESENSLYDIFGKRTRFFHTEFVTLLTKTKKTKLSSAKHHASILNTLPSLIFGTEQVFVTAQSLTTHAISNCQIRSSRYWSTWDINQLYDHWRSKPDSRFISNEELQTKLAQLMISLCFVRILREHFQRSPNYFIHLFWTNEWQQADQRRINNHFEKLVCIIGLQTATAKSIKHASSTELAVLGFGGRTINIFTLHTLDSKKNMKFQVLAVNRQQDFIATALVKNHGKMQAEPAIYTISKYWDDARVSDGDVLQQSPYGVDLQLSPQDIHASLHSLPTISTQRIFEVRSPNDCESTRGQESQMQKDDQDEEQSCRAPVSSMTMNYDQIGSVNAQI
ncbi:MAG: hypothetical protein EZS28_005048 [Streblomastix strix]|uniref:Uncharacterized protein n=1 Tax=Streblomastix strix TaxID=222440 RepID=A0A5J4WYY2_9EUKA|nr:MAG: hypothetical protein EZS28_005048 [Streblomastix strix]